MGGIVTGLLIAGGTAAATGAFSGGGGGGIGPAAPIAGKIAPVRMEAALDRGAEERRAGLKKRRRSLATQRDLGEPTLKTEKLGS